MVWCASFDIGKINFAFYIEEFDKDKLPKNCSCSYNPDGTPDENTTNILESVCKNGKTILHRNYNLETCKNNDVKMPKKKKEDKKRNKENMHV